MAGDGDKEAVICGEKDLIQYFFRAHRLRRRRLARDPVPQLVALGEARLKAPGRERSLDDSPVAAPVARVDADVLAEFLQDQGRELGRAGGQAQSLERDLRRLQRPEQGTDEVAVRGVDALLINLPLPEVARLPGLRDAVAC